jgi:hypothetical protein
MNAATGTLDTGRAGFTTPSRGQYVFARDVNRLVDQKLDDELMRVARGRVQVDRAVDAYHALLERASIAA